MTSMLDQLTDSELMERSVRVPDHVVHRAFVAETVVLNLQTGRYHGLNPSAGRMLVVLEAGGRIREAAGALAKEYDQPLELIERDLAQLCRQLLERKLIELSSGTPG
jgi:hypothetical protein